MFAAGLVAADELIVETDWLDCFVVPLIILHLPGHVVDPLVVLLRGQDQQHPEASEEAFALSWVEVAVVFADSGVLHSSANSLI